MKLRLLPLMLTLALAPALVAAEDAKAPAAAASAARQAELEKAQADLEAAARRVAELGGGTGQRQREVVIHRAGPESSRPGVGIVMSPAAKGPGVLIAAVTPDGPASKAGLRAGDVLTRVDGKALAGTGSAAIDDARKRLGGLAMDQAIRLDYTRDGKPGTATVKAGNIHRVMVFNTRHAPEDGGMHFNFESAAPMVDGDVEVEIRQFGTAPCAPGSSDCGMPVLSQAIRWNGLNLASMDAKLGRYFGTDTGVLVLSGGPGMTALEPGDVIKKIEGGAVATPRDAMRALRDREPGAKVRVELLRERKTRTVEVTVPDAPPMQWFAPPPPLPPAPPAPPAPPTPPSN